MKVRILKKEEGGQFIYVYCVEAFHKNGWKQIFKSSKLENAQIFLKEMVQGLRRASGSFIPQLIEEVEVKK